MTQSGRFRPTREARPRQCFRQTCSEASVASMSYDYAGQVVSINALSRDAHPTEYELCAVHTELLTVPRGWKISLGDGAPIRPRSMDVVDFAAFVAQRAASA